MRVSQILYSSAFCLVRPVAILAIFASPFVAHAQAESEKNLSQAATYVSQTDQDLTIRRISLLPVIDNVEGIYARPVEARLIELLKSAHRWDYVESGFAGDGSTLPSLLELEETPGTMQKLTRSIDADAVLAASATKGPNGLSIRLDLFLKKDGKLLGQELLKDYQRSNISDIKQQISILYRNLLQHIPYDGIILSRDGNRVTLNLGQSDGLAKDQMLTAIQIISVNRHPKFNFVISTEKEILGRIKILKVDETLSFGAIVAEKERGAITKFAKISGVTPVTYPEPVGLENGNTASDLAARTDGNVTFGKDPREWLPAHPPSFGQVGARLGLGSYTSNQGPYSSRAPLYPSLGINGEIWITPTFTVRADVLQGTMFSVTNPRPGSQPGSLSESEARYSLEFGYNFLLRDDFFGPKIQITAGYAAYKFFVDNSTPVGLTTQTYQGLVIGANASFPVSDDKIWTAGGRLNFWVLPAMEEDPVSSGDSNKNSVTEFSFFVEKRLSQNLRATGALEIGLYNTSFSGQGTRKGDDGTTPDPQATASHQKIALTCGLNYLF